MMDYWRQLDVFSPSSFDTPVTVIGAGGIGSPTTLALAKMGVSRLAVYDHDSVEEHNLPNQLYRIEDIEKRKVDALALIVKQYADLDIEAHASRFTDQAVRGVVISAVDSMETRQAIWQRLRYNPSVSLYIEARMGAEVARVHTLNPTNPDAVRWYETTLYSDSEASEVPCTARAIIYNVFLIAALIGNQVKKFSRGEALAREIIFDFVTLTFLSNEEN